ncbi:MAG: hypothetical protein Q7S06_01610 [Nanoarchaeota archaeon]|nr:hypothetical protein [Nanoarchaeota archaeon]
MLEASRINKINQMYLETDMNILDQRVLNDAQAIIDFDCQYLIAENIKFGDKIYEDALQIKKYEDANRINNDIISQHRKYDLLRTLFWVNSMKIKQKCNSDFHTVVYIYKYNNPSVQQTSEQNFFSNLLSELKQKYGNQILLIPIAGDNNLVSLDLLIKKYDITQLPVILIDEQTKMTEVKSMEDIEKYLK